MAISKCGSDWKIIKRKKKERKVIEELFKAITGKRPVSYRTKVYHTKNTIKVVKHKTKLIAYILLLYLFKRSNGNSLASMCDFRTDD